MTSESLVDILHIDCGNLNQCVVGLTIPFVWTHHDIHSLGQPLTVLNDQVLVGDGKFQQLYLETMFIS